MYVRVLEDDVAGPDCVGEGATQGGDAGRCKETRVDQRTLVSLATLTGESLITREERRASEQVFPRSSR